MQAYASDATDAAFAASNARFAQLVDWLAGDQAAGMTHAQLEERLHADGLTLIVIEHVMAAMMRLAQRIVVLHHGERIAEGTPVEIASDRRVIDAYLGEEFSLAEA